MTKLRFSASFFVVLAAFYPPYCFAEDFQSALNQAKQQWEQGRFSDAATHIVEMSKTARADIEVAEAKAWQMRLANAEGRFRDALAVAPPIADAAQRSQRLLILQQANAQKGMGNFADAEKAYSQLVEDHDSPGAGMMAEAAVALSEIRMWKGDWEGAERYYQRAASLYNSLPAAGQAQILNLRGDLEVERGRLNEAETQYTKAMGILTPLGKNQDPELAAARIGLVEIRIKQGRGREIGSLLDEAREVCSFLNTSAVYLRFEDVRGRSQLLGGDREGAAAHIRDRSFVKRTENQHFQSLESLDSLAMLDLANGDTKAAITNLEKGRAGLARLLGPNSPLLAPTLVHLAEAYRRANRFQEALAAIDEAAQIEQNYLDPDSIEAAERSFERGSLAIDLGDFDKAEGTLLHTRDIWREKLADGQERIDADCYWGIAEAYLGKTADAAPLLEKWLSTKAAGTSITPRPGLLEVKAAYALALQGNQKYADAITFYLQVTPSLQGERQVEFMERTGDCYMRLHDLANSVKSLRNALQLAMKVSDQGVTARRISYSLANVALDSNDVEQAQAATDIWSKGLTDRDLNARQIDVIDRLGEAFFKKGDYNSAEPYLRRVITIVNGSRGRSFEERHLFELASACERQEKYTPAAELYEQSGASLIGHDLDRARESFGSALRLRERVAGSQSALLVPPLLQLGDIAIKQTDYKSADECLRRAHSILNLSTSPDPFHLAAVLNEQGMLLKAQGKANEASSIFMNANLLVGGKANAPQSLRASILFNLGSLALEESRKNDADRYFEACLKLNPSAEQAEEIGSFFARIKRYEEAEAQYRKASEIRSATFGPESPQAAIGFYILADFYDARGNFAQAVEYANRVLTIYEAASAGDSSEAMNTRSLLADIYDGQGKFADAVTLRERLTLGATSPDTAQLNQLAADYRNVKDWPRALATYQKVAQIWESHGLSDANFRAAQANVAVALQRTGHHDEAETLFRSLRTYFQARGPWQEEEAILVVYSAALADSNQPGQKKESNKLASEAKRLQQRHTASR